MNISKKVIQVIKQIQDAGYEAYLVGGCVRDMIRGIEPHDYDITTSAHPEQIKEIFPFQWDSGIKYGTITVSLDNDFSESFEITTFRKETGYADNRHPNEILYADTIEEDLCRRDFTMNAIAYDPIKQIMIDPYHGREDILHQMIRCVGNPKDRFQEDALRILRAIRFSMNFGYSVHVDTQKALLEARDKLMYISKERITEELEKILTKSNQQHLIHGLIQYEPIITTIIPDLKQCVGFQQNSAWHKHNVYEHIIHVVAQCEHSSFEIMLAALLHDIGKPHVYTIDNDGIGHFYGHQEVSYELSKNILKNNLRLTKKSQDKILSLVKYHDMQIVETKTAAKHMLNKFGPDFCLDWLILKHADLSDHQYPKEKEAQWKDTWQRYHQLCSMIDEVIQEQAVFSIKDLAINGHDIMESCHIKSGPIIGQILKNLLEDVISEKVQNNKEALLDIVNQYMYHQYEDCLEL